MSATATTKESSGATFDPVARARELAPKIRGAAADTDRNRRVSSDIIGAMTSAGLFHMMIPTDLGGSQSDPVQIFRAVEEVSAADGSTGWCLMIALQNSAFAGVVPAEDAREIFSNGGIACGTARPIGRLEMTNSPAEGYIVSGRWPFASGSSHATWFACEGVVYDGAHPLKDAEGNDVTRMTFVPRDKVRILETWDTTGLRGTASNDFIVDKVWVPASRGFQMLVTPPVHPWPLYQALAIMFVTQGSHALGVARGAIEEAKAIAATKPAWGAPGTVKEQPRFQVALAEAVAIREAAAAFLYDSTEACWNALVGGDNNAMLRSRVRLATSHAVRAATQAVDLVHDAVGTSGIFTANPIERHFRDIHTAAAHIMVAPLTFESAGRVEMGMEPTFPFF
ncbi:hypothetical protein AYO38_00035 [bacterium SCGC AG-212-C10]|nr:hypothetical protein AYO38_00035 [bacterium SCGC AG-212-C10]